MSAALALTKLHEDVEALFFDDGMGDIPQPFGWREPDKRTGAMRIVWVPGDDEDAGEIAPPRNPGRNPRPLGTLLELFTVYIEAVDPSAYETEEAQYTAARLLFDAWYRAVYKAAHGTFEVQSVAWVTDKKLRRYGATMKVVCTIEAMIPDSINDAVTTGARAVIDVSELDVTETMISHVYQSLNPLAITIPIVVTA